LLHDEPSPRRHEGFMVATMNPVGWDDVRHSASSDEQRGAAAAGGPRASLTLHDANHEGPTQGFLVSTPLARRPAQSRAFQTGGGDH
jgi:hypothetical protein